MHREPSPSPSDPSLREAPTAELLELALRQTAALVRAEVSLATSELRSDVTGALLAAGSVVVAIALLSLAVALLVAVLILVLGASLLTTLLGTAGVLVVLGALAAYGATRLVPNKGILVRSRERLAVELREVREHAA